MKKLWRSQRGTAEIVGTVFFLIILAFVFSNVFLWYNGVSLKINTVIGDKANSPIEMAAAANITAGQYNLTVSAVGGKDVQLIRIWIIEVENNNHICIDLKDQFQQEIWVPGGSYLNITIGDRFQISENGIEINYRLEEGMGEVRFRILTDLGNTASAYFTLN